MGKEMLLTIGRPAGEGERLQREIRTYDFLDRLGVSYERVDHAPADTMEICHEIETVLRAGICKNLFLCNRQQTSFYLLMMPGDKPFKTREISGQIGSARLSFAPEEKMLEYLDIEPGAVSVMGLVNDTEKHVQLLVDEDVLKEGYLGCHPCVNTSSLRLRTKDVFDVIVPATGHDKKVVHLTGL